MSQSISELESFATRGLNELREWAAVRGMAYGMERSARIQQDTLETRRGLFSFSVQEIESNAAAEVLAICRAMQVPERLVPSIGRFFSAAAFVHFGFEHAGTALIGKCYLELPAPTPEAVPVSGRLQFLGFKWSMNVESVAVVTRYRVRSISSWDGATALMVASTGTALQSVVLRLMHGLRPGEARENDTLSLLEIEEEGSVRRSYDLNVYDHGLSVSMLANALRDAAVILNVKRDMIDSWLESNATVPVGHIATGLGRDQQPFLTVYYDARRAGDVNPLIVR